MAEFTAEDMEKLLAPYGGMANALTMLATRPQKSLVRTNNVSTSTPYALENMIANRDRIGQASTRLSDTLRAQENPWFSTIKALGQVQGSTEPGGWLASGLKGFSTGATMLADIKAANDAMRLDNEMKDLAEILAYDTAMGNKTTSNQTQNTTYEQLPYGGTGNKTNVKGGGDTLGGIPTTNFGRSVGYDPTAHIPDYGMATRAALDDSQISTPFKYIGGGQSFSKGVTKDTDRQWLQTTWQDISDNILKGSTLKFVGDAGSVRIADTEEEKRAILGELYNYKTKDPDELRQLLQQARNNFVTVGLQKAKEQGVPVTAEDLVAYWNSAFTVPDYLQSPKMYNTADAAKYKDGGQPKNDDPWAAYRVPETK